MNKKKYLGIIALITVACIIGGSIWHGHRLTHNKRTAEMIEQELAEAKEEIRQELAEEKEDTAETAASVDETATEEADLTSVAAVGTTGDIAAHESASELQAAEEKLPKRFEKMIPVEGTQKNGRSIPFEGIDVETGVFDIYIQEGADYGVYYYVLDEKFNPQAEIKNGMLSVKQPGFLSQVKSISDVLDYLVHPDDLNAELLITVPEGTELDSVGINSGAGDADIRNISTGNLDLDLSADDVDMETVTANNVEIDCSAGDVEMNTVAANDMLIDCSAGDVKMANTTVNTVSFQCSAGDVKMDNCAVNDLTADLSAGDFKMNGLKKLADYSMDLQTSAGDIEVNGNRMEDCYKQSGKADLRIGVSSSAGDIEINP